MSAVLDAALELAAPERAAYLAEACADDADLQRHVEELLAADADARSFLVGSAVERAASLVADVAGQFDLPPPATGEGRIVGVYLPGMQAVLNGTETAQQVMDKVRQTALQVKKERKP